MRFFAYEIGRCRLALFEEGLVIRGGSVVIVGLELGGSCCDVLDVMAVAIVGLVKRE